MSTAISLPPPSYLPGGFVTEINRQALWDALTDAQRAQYTSTSTGSSTSTGTSGGSGTSSGTTSTAPTFKSLGSSTTLSSAAFTGRTDARSAAPNNSILTGYSALWDPDNLITAQLATLANGGAIFVNVVAGSIADGDRPQDGANGNLANIRGQNPFGFFDAGEFVRVRDGVETRFAGGTAAVGYSEWLATARVAYDAYNSLVSSQITEVQSLFGSSQQGLLGFDVNNNGLLDNETELFGFDAGLDIDGTATIKYGTGTTQTDGSFTFLSASGRLNGDPLDPDTDNSFLDEYRRFMILTGAGQSVAVLQSDIGYSAATDSYVKAQTRFQLDAVGGASLTIVTQDGFSVTPTYTSPISATGNLPGIAQLGRPEDGANGNIANIRGQNPYGYLDGGLFYRFDTPGLTAGAVTAFDPVADPAGYAAAIQDFNGFETFLTNQRNTLLASLGTGPFELGFDVDGSGGLAATEYFGAGLNLYGSATLNDATLFRFLTGDRLSGDPLNAGTLAGDIPYFNRFRIRDSLGAQSALDQTLTTAYTALDGLSSFDVTSRTQLEIQQNGQFRINIITELGTTVTAT